MNATQHLASSHLSDEQFYAVLASPTVSDQHLKECGTCQAELASLQASLTGLRGALTNLAATTPLPEYGRQPVILSSSPFRYAWLTRNSIAAGFASILIVAAGSLAMIHPARTPASPQAVPQQIALSDEALLEGISQDLSTSVPPTLAPLTVTETASSHR